MSEFNHRDIATSRQSSKKAARKSARRQLGPKIDCGTMIAGAAAAVLSMFATPKSASAQITTATWTGNADGTTWDNGFTANWNTGSWTNGTSNFAIFTGIPTSTNVLLTAPSSPAGSPSPRSPARKRASRWAFHADHFRKFVLSPHNLCQTYI